MHSAFCGDIKTPSHIISSNVSKEELKMLTYHDMPGHLAVGFSSQSHEMLVEAGADVHVAGTAQFLDSHHAHSPDHAQHFSGQQRLSPPRSPQQLAADKTAVQLADIAQRPNSRAAFDAAMEDRTSKFFNQTRRYNRPSTRMVVETLHHARELVSNDRVFINRPISQVEKKLLKSPFAKKVWNPDSSKSTKQIMNDLAITSMSDKSNA